LRGELPKRLREVLAKEIVKLDSYLLHADIPRMQQIWTHRGPGLTSPFMLLDELDAIGARLIPKLECHPAAAERLVRLAIETRFSGKGSVVGSEKLVKHAPLIAAGLLIGGISNEYLQRPAVVASIERIAVG
jgi:DNA (cytosine-5)-methyltransferase 1